MQLPFGDELGEAEIAPWHEEKDNWQHAFL
jgi:hypothetical protein